MAGRDSDLLDIQDGLRETIHRSIYWSGQSPFYYLIARVALVAGGPHEILLRIPSVVAMALAAYLLYKLAVRLFDADTAPLAVLVFVCLEQIAFAAADARPSGRSAFFFLEPVMKNEVRFHSEIATVSLPLRQPEALSSLKRDSPVVCQVGSSDVQ